MKKLQKLTVLASTLVLSSIFAPSADASKVTDVSSDLQPSTSLDSKDVENTSQANDTNSTVENSSSLENSSSENIENIESVEESQQVDTSLNIETTQDTNTSSSQTTQDKEDLPKDVKNSTTNSSTIEEEISKTAKDSSTNSMSLDFENSKLNLNTSKIQTSLAKTTTLKEVEKSSDGKSVLKSDGESYKFYENGVLQKNKTVELNSKIYQIDKYGKAILAVNKWVSIDNQKYYVDAKGNLTKGLSTIGNTKYLFDESGKLLKNTSVLENNKLYSINSEGIAKLDKNSWINYNGKVYYNDQNGDITKGLKTINNNTYYFDKDGVALTNQTLYTQNKLYNIDKRGVVSAITNQWVLVGGNSYYANEKSQALKGLQTIDDKSYYFDESGKLLKDTKVLYQNKIYSLDKNGLATNKKKSWIRYNGKTYYNDKNGELTKGLAKINKNLYYFDDNGVALTNKTVYTQNKFYSTDTKGLVKPILSKWVKYNGKAYFSDKNGNPIKGLRTVYGNTYYFDNTGAATTNETVFAKNKFYSTDSKGLVKPILSKWIKYNGKAYFNDKNGDLLKGLRKVYRNTYYFDENGAVTTDKRVYAEGKIFDTDKKGLVSLIKKKWIKYNGKTYYNDKDGNLSKGLTTINKNKYYFDSTGAVLTDQMIHTSDSFYKADVRGVVKTIVSKWVKFEGNTYYSDSSGNISKGFRKIHKNTYYFNNDGIALTDQILYTQTRFYNIDKKGLVKRLTNQWVTYQGKEFYTDSKAKAVKGIVKIGNDYYHLTDNGKTTNKTLVIEDTTYSFDKDGKGVITAIQNPYRDLDAMIDWMYAAMKSGMVYNMGAYRNSSFASDCSSAVYRAMIAGGFLPEGSFIGNTETLFALGRQGTILKEISESEIRYGDIFVSGTPGQSIGAGGHTGFILDKNTIIHSNYRDNGVSVTERIGRMGDASGRPVRYYRLVGGTSRKLYI